ncbi:hypothetical protein GT037_001538 [Alternaria burnsii]|uniref:Uncharacterized protein n=1 Tax=Alternaria burnsii TaxID=1187904 RepID=A0A8H7BE07_9PLEO|nr:uncharacterized protein GT037_001538 [Alternaria burnsii]KAF7679887.1 hypothetical protein GT037_001538 [Alternaria burnsii]
MYNTRELIASTASASIRQLPMNSSSGLTRTILNLVCRVCNLISNFNCPECHCQAYRVWSRSRARCAQPVSGSQVIALGTLLLPQY